MFTLTIKGLWAHKLRYALTSLAIVLGVAFMAGTMVLMPICVRRSFRSSSVMALTRCFPAMSTCIRGSSRKIIFTTLCSAIQAS